MRLKIMGKQNNGRKAIRHSGNAEDGETAKLWSVPLENRT
jgi:hypothetical protein